MEMTRKTTASKAALSKLPFLGRPRTTRSLPKVFSTVLDIRCAAARNGRCKWGSFCHCRHGPKKYVPKAVAEAQQLLPAVFARTGA